MCCAGLNSTGQAGLPNLLAMVMGGLAAQTPHMVSACVMALARLLFEVCSLLTGPALEICSLADILRGHVLTFNLQLGSADAPHGQRVCHGPGTSAL